MQRRLVDILACPADKHNPLQLIEFSSQGEVVIDGLLYCQQCGRFFPIADELPVLLPDEMRNQKDDVEFLNKWREKIPNQILTSGKPFNLSR